LPSDPAALGVGVSVVAATGTSLTLTRGAGSPYFIDEGGSGRITAGFECTNGSAASAAMIRRSRGKSAFAIWERKKSNGKISGFFKAAVIAAFRNAVFLLGVPRCRPPRRSPGKDPLGIATLLLSRF
jgi:hypothetical protein